MKKILLIVIGVVILFLDWLALDDITTGTEPNFFGEYTIVVASVPILLLAGHVLLKRRSK